MFKYKVISVAIASSLLASTALANTKNKDDQDSVKSWGPWQGVQTAAGPGGGSIVPFTIQFIESQNTTDGDAFVPDVDSTSEPVDNAGFREYHAWYSRGKHEERKSTERANFTRLEINEFADGAEGGSRKGKGKSGEITFAVGTDAHENEFTPRTMRFRSDDVGSVDSTEISFLEAYSEKEVSREFLNRKRTKQEVKYNEQGILIGFFSAEEGSVDGLAVGSSYGATTTEILKRKYNKKGDYYWWKTVDSRTRVNNETAFAYGQTSSIDAVSNLLSGALSVNYKGFFSGLNSPGLISETPGRIGVDINIQVGGAPTWEGTFNMAKGASFAVTNGTFNGVDLTGTASNIADSTNVISGQVDASFFGANAEAIAGIADVNFEKQGRLVDVFVASQGVGELPDIGEGVVEAVAR